MRERAELLRHLDDQLGFLRSDAAAFDSGDPAFAKRLAVSLRLLLRTKGRQVSLLTQLGILDRTVFRDTAVPLGTGQLGWPALLQLRLTGAGPSFVPRLGSGDRNPDKDFQAWWTEPLDQLPDGRSFSRSHYVLGLAEREGGVHLDPAFDALHSALERDNAFGWIDMHSNLPIADGTVAACVRQIAYETHETLRPLRSTLIA